jgi:hypothetical protein
METLKGEWGVLGKTEAGKQVSHLAFCIKVALPAQARPIPLFVDGRYVGAFVSGYGWVMMVDGKEYRPQEFKTVLEEIEKSTTHTVTLEKILVLLGVSGSPGDAMGDVYKIARDPSTTMMELRDRCIGGKVSVAETQEIKKLAKSLDFHTAHWSMNANHITRALSLICDVSAALPRDLPINPSVLFTNDRVDVVWSCFGPLAPTFRPNNGQLVSISDPTYTVTMKRGPETVSEEKPNSVFHVAQAELSTAIADLKELRESSKVGILRQVRRESKYALREFKGEEHARIKGILMTFCGAVSSTERPGRAVVIDRDDEMFDDDDL